MCHEGGSQDWRRITHKVQARYKCGTHNEKAKQFRFDYDSADDAGYEKFKEKVPNP